MKITIGKLRSLIREAMVSTLAPGMKVVVDHEEVRSITVTITEDGKPRAHGPGFITLQRIQVEGGTIWEVVSSSARKGFGPLLYDIAMEYVVGRVGDMGITPDTARVSPEAQRVWDFYLENRGDVEHEVLPPSFIHAADRPESLRNYYYKLGTPILDELEGSGVIVYKS